MAAEEEQTAVAGAPATRAVSTGGLASFLPWVVYGVLSGFGYWGPAVAFGLITALYPTVVRLLRGSSVKLIDWTMLAFFAVATVLVLAVRETHFPEYNAVLVWVLFAGMAWGSVLLKAPFTLEFARESTPEEFWTQPLFIRTNLIITLVWCAAFTIDLIVALVLMRPGGGTTLAMWIVPAITLGGAVVFTRRYAAAAQARAQVVQDGAHS